MRIRSKLLVPCLMAFASVRVLAQSPSPSAVTEIKTATSTVVVDQVILSTTWLPGCKPPICVTAKAPERFLAVMLKPKDALAAGNISKETEKAYVVTPEGVKSKRWDFGFSVDREGQLTYILGFKVRSTGDVFSLSWPGGADYKLTASAQK
jgi:hypothetical protein